jgi:radical SAM protein with 4Fe4S-binding SPASM domain
MRDFVEEQTLLNEDPARVGHYFGEARAAARRLGVQLRLPRTRPREHAPGTPGPERCDWPWRGAYVSYQGYAMPCCMIATPDRMNFGSVNDRPLDAIWNGEAYDAFRRQLASDGPPEICSSCSVYHRTF